MNCQEEVGGGEGVKPWRDKTAVKQLKSLAEE